MARISEAVLSMLLATAISIPAAADPPSVEVRVDPRVELMSIIFRLAGNREYSQGRIPAYNEAVEAHFGPHRDHPVVLMARTLRQTRGVSYDAVMSMAIHLTDAADLNEALPFDGENVQLDSRWGLEGARAFLDHARDFVVASNFAGFLEQQQDLHAIAQERMQAFVDEHADLEWFDSFFGTAQAADFTVVVGLFNGGGNYGPKLVRPDGGESLYAVMGTWLIDEHGLPYFNESVLPTLVHEFCHSYVNHLIEENRDELAEAGAAMFSVVEAAMRRQAYGNWETMLKESLVRACVVRYVHDQQDAEAAERQIQQEVERQFLWMPELVALLDDYAASRTEYPTLGSFMPKVVDFFSATAATVAAEAATRDEALDAARPRIVSTTPESGAENVSAALTEIVVTFDRPMQSGYSVMLDEARGLDAFPQVQSSGFDSSRTIFTMKVSLRPGVTYSFSFNGEAGGNFRSAEGTPLRQAHFSFTTAEDE